MQNSRVINSVIEPGEFWWGGAVADGQAMPFGNTAHARDLACNTGYLHDPTDGANQAAPLLLSSAGRALWSDRPFRFTIEPGVLRVEGEAVIETANAPGGTLRDAFLLASSRYFPPSGRAPARELVDGPQYNTWIEMPYTPTQEGVLAYARSLLEAGLPPGAIIIDDNWAPDYGDWQFDRTRFPDPQALVDELHALGFSVMLWIVPFVSPDGAVFRMLRERGLLLRGGDGEVAVRHWWNGYSGVLDLTNADSMAWFREQLDRLMAEVGVDGFKFDAGDIRDFRDDDLAANGTSPVDQCEAWARLGIQYPFNEFRASWKSGGLPLAQRLHDKPPTWGAGGLGSLIPEGIAQGLVGHPFICADMVGGGDLARFADVAGVDQEHFVRYAQCASLFPMLQFSLSPARMLDAEHLAATLAAVKLRQSLMPEMLALVDHAAATGEPIVRAMAYHHPGLETVTDQFMLGEDLLVAPVLDKGAKLRTLIVPEGIWRSLDGEVEIGSGEVDLPVELTSLPVFRRLG